MASTYLENRISSQVASQLPAHVRHHYETFVFFAEAYYEFLEQKQYPQEIIQNIREYSDIDQSIEDFITYFYKNYCADFPTNPLADKKTTLKHIHELYQHKGSEKAIKLLFRILYNNDVDFYYPEIQVLKASGGRWKGRLSIRVNGSFAQLKNLIGQRITGSISGANARIIDAQQIDSINQVIELFLDQRSINGHFAPNENISGNWPGQSNELFLSRLTNAFFNRDPLESEILYYVDALKNEDLTPAQVLKTLILTTEAETFLQSNLDFLKVLMIQARGAELETFEFTTNFGPRLLNGIPRSVIVDEILAGIDSQEFLKNVLRYNDSIIITANVRPVVSNVTVIDRGYNYNVGDIITIDTDVRGNNGLKARIAEVSYFSKKNYDSNLANAGNLQYGIVKVELDDFETVNVTTANANLILSTFDLNRANVQARTLYANDMPNLHAEIVSGNLSLSFGQGANIIAHIGAHCEYPGFWKKDSRTSIQEGSISLPESEFGGSVFRGRKDDGGAEDDITRFVDDVFYFMLNRTPSYNERVYYKSLIKKGLDLNNYLDYYADVIIEISKRPEFLSSNNFKLTSEFIRVVYRTAVGVYPDSSLVDFYFNTIKKAADANVAKLQVVVDIARSIAAKTHYDAAYNPKLLIEDAVYFQPFSYELQTSENINVWREIVKKLVHPAGLVFFGRNKIFPPPRELLPPQEKLPPKVRGLGSVKGIHQYLNVAIRVLKSLPSLAAVTPRIMATDQILSSVTRSNSNISYVGAGPRFETIDTWKFSSSATVDGQDQMYAQILANVSISQFDADNIRNKFYVAPPLYVTNTLAFPWTFTLSASANNINEGQVITFTVQSGNVPDGTEIVYVIEESGNLANTDLRRGDVAFLLDGLVASDPVANAAHLLYQNPIISSGFYYVNWLV